MPQVIAASEAGTSMRRNIKDLINGIAACVEEFMIIRLKTSLHKTEKLICCLDSYFVSGLYNWDVR